jgi:small-conductance mechanosensitive channel
MASELYLVTGSIVIIVSTLLIEEGISFVIRRAAKIAKVRPSVIRDIAAGLRVVAILVIVTGILGITGLSSEFTSLTISGIGALAASLALQSTLSNVIAGILLMSDGVIHVDDVVTYSGLKGKVVRIALRNTWIELDSGDIAVVSNSSISNGPLVNHTAVERLSKKFALK